MYASPLNLSSNGYKTTQLPTSCYKFITTYYSDAYLEMCNITYYLLDSYAWSKTSSHAFMIPLPIPPHTQLCTVEN